MKKGAQIGSWDDVFFVFFVNCETLKIELSLERELNPDSWGRSEIHLFGDIFEHLFQEALKIDFFMIFDDFGMPWGVSWDHFFEFLVIKNSLIFLMEKKSCGEF